MTSLLAFKSLHIIGFVSWFAGMFYLVRMFIYHVEAGERPEGEKKILQDQFRLMQNRVYKIIMNPAMMITWTGGIGMLVTNPAYLSQGWIHVKLTLVVLLTVYHLYSKRIMKNIQAGTNTLTSGKLRMYNEIATLFLVAIVLVAVYGRLSLLNFVYAFLTVVGVGVLLFTGIRYYKKVQAKNPEA